MPRLEQLSYVVERIGKVYEQTVEDHIFLFSLIRCQY
jgi:hypothetical protein